MSRMRTVAVLTSVIDALHEHGGTSGPDHLQCAVYLLIHAAKVQMDFRFERFGIGGIRSTAMQGELARLCADGLLEKKRSRRFELVLVPTQAGRTITKSFPRTVGNASGRIRSVARSVAGTSRKDAQNVVLAWQRMSGGRLGRPGDDGIDPGIAGAREQGRASRRLSRANERAKELIEALARSTK